MTLVSYFFICLGSGNSNQEEQQEPDTLEERVVEPEDNQDDLQEPTALEERVVEPEDRQEELPEPAAVEERAEEPVVGEVPPVDELPAAPEEIVPGLDNDGNEVILEEPAHLPEVGGAAVNVEGLLGLAAGENGGGHQTRRGRPRTHNPISEERHQRWQRRIEREAAKKRKSLERLMKTIKKN